jgi:hypothetical protein
MSNINLLFMLQALTEIDEENEVEILDLEMAKWWFKTIYNIELSDIKIVTFICKYYNKNNTTFPTKEEIEKEFCKVDCICEYAYTPSSIIDLKKFTISSYGRLPNNCRELELILEYHTLNKAYPTLEELRKYNNNFFQFRSDPVSYFNNDKVDRPSNNLTENLIIKSNCHNEEKCSICFEEIGSSDYYKLPCNHVFHKEKYDCLEDASIEEWFKKNNFCPNCKTIL